VGAPSSTSRGEERVIHKKGRGKDVVALFNKQKHPLKFASLPVSYSSEHGNIVTHILAHVVRQDECGSFSMSRNHRGQRKDGSLCMRYRLMTWAFGLCLFLSAKFPQVSMSLTW